MLDERLALVKSLVPPCSLGADIGSDHGFLPRALLLEGICERMLVTDISAKALRHAEQNLQRAGLTASVRLLVGDGLQALDEPCQVISITGMGGDTIARILQTGQQRLNGATLILSAHTEPELVRATLQDIGYAIQEERLCLCRGRYYLVWQAMPGQQLWTPQALRVGQLLWTNPSTLLKDYACHRLAVLERKAAALRQFSQQPDLLRQTEEDIAFYQVQQSYLP